MNLLNEIQETTLMMNIYQQHHLQQQQLLLQQQQSMASANDGGNPRSMQLPLQQNGGGSVNLQRFEQHGLNNGQSHLIPPESQDNDSAPNHRQTEDDYQVDRDKRHIEEEDSSEKEAKRPKREENDVVAYSV